MNKQVNEPLEHRNQRTEPSGTLLRQGGQADPDPSQRPPDGRAQLTPLPQYGGAPDGRFSSSSLLVLPSSPGAGRCRLTVSSDPLHTGHPLFLTPRKEHGKGWSRKQEGKHLPWDPSHQRLGTLGIPRVQSESGFSRDWGGLGESAGRWSGVGSAREQSLKSSSGSNSPLVLAAHLPARSQKAWGAGRPGLGPQLSN